MGDPLPEWRHYGSVFRQPREVLFQAALPSHAGQIHPMPIINKFVEATETVFPEASRSKQRHTGKRRIAFWQGPSP
jgi:hypothetical protein